MNLKQLESFVWINRLGGFSAAAAKLNTTQPAISQRIRELETELGVTLINRTPRGVTLTPKGRECLEFAERILDEASDLRARVGSAESLSGRTRVGVGESVALTWLPAMLARLNNEYPGLSVDVVVDITQPLCRGLESGDFDVIILGGANLTSQAHVVDLGFGPLFWMARGDPGSWSGPVAATELQEHRILMLSHETMINRIAEDWFAEHGVRPERRHMCNSMAVLASLTMAGLGISLLPLVVFQQEVSDGRLCIIPTDHPTEAISYKAIYRPIHWPSFGRIIAETAKEVTTFAQMWPPATESGPMIAAYDAP